ncbi:MAG: hypothetical protein JW395_3676 [Nitrospira sp.]|nr:hypothetical protein [Nitrospira sp.]
MAPHEVMISYFEAEMTRSVDAIMEFFAVDAVFTTPDRVYSGTDEIRRFYEDSASRFVDLEVTIVTALSRGDQGVVEWGATLGGRDGSSLQLSGVNVARVADGRICAVRSYYDAASYNE